MKDDDDHALTPDPVDEPNPADSLLEPAEAIELEDEVSLEGEDLEERDLSGHKWGGDWGTDGAADDDSAGEKARDSLIDPDASASDITDAADADVGSKANDALRSEPSLEPPDAPHEPPADVAPTVEDGPQSTVFQPRPTVVETTVPPAMSEPAHDATVFQPAARPPHEPTAVATDSREPSAWSGTGAGLTSIAPAAVSSAQRVEVGVVLTGLYEITRFIARGGMGEVWEGCNINDEHDRVAIKVVLPSLAADPSVQAMFRKEARTLKRLSHKAVAQYRVIASDPRLNILYIVTEFVDGVNLADVMPTLKPDEADLRALLVRLAEGLRAAHEIGAIHRDMTPDNVILEGGQIAGARIIDFGVAKDLDPAKGTIVGDGFAGKLGFAAPEQFGDYGREVGPWTDVYSLGLVILAVAAGRNPDMGATLVDAVDRRRQGVDVSAAPDKLQPVLEAMLKADPAQRLRSMDAVLEAAAAGGMTAKAPTLEKAPARPERPFGKRKDPGTPAASPEAPSGPPDPGAKTGPTDAVRNWLADPRHRMVAFGTGGLAVVAAGALVLAVVLGGTGGGTVKAGVAGGPVATAAVTDGEAVRRAVEAALATVPCSWMEIDSLEATEAGVAMRLSGAAGDAGIAQAAMERAVADARAPVSDLDLSGVLAAPPVMCRAVDALRPLRVETSAQQRRLTAAQSIWVMETLDGRTVAYPVLDLNIGDPTIQFVVLGIDVVGGPVVISKGREQLKALAGAGRKNAVDLGGDRYRISFPMDEPGLFAIVLLTGPIPLDAGLLDGSDGDPGPWLDRFRQAASAAGWKGEILWHQVTPPT